MKGRILTPDFDRPNILHLQTRHDFLKVLPTYLPPPLEKNVLPLFVVRASEGEKYWGGHRFKLRGVRAKTHPCGWRVV